ncbi:MAG: hypothetical protein ACYTGX_07175 [Planctomycetota bacterium]|jgi:hypothetical protein
MRTIASAALGAALVTGAAAGFAVGEEPTPPRFEVHEFGYLDLNRPQTMQSWLRTIPKNSAINTSARWGAEQGWRESVPVPRDTPPNDPTLLFYADRALRVNVRVGFRQGAPVAWWPNGTADGRFVRFDRVLVDPKLKPASPRELDTAKYPGLAPLKYLREAGATPVKVDGRIEGGLVYEGVLPFQPRLTVRHVEKTTYGVRNDGNYTVHDVILIPKGERTKGYLLGDLKPGATRRVVLKDTEKLPLTSILDLQLGRTGLYPKEVTALRKTLLSPDFMLDPGVRLMARVPESEWRSHFPLQITPRPRQLLRVGVLRIFDAVRYRAAEAQTVPLESVPASGTTRERRPVPAPAGTAGGR